MIEANLCEGTQMLSRALIAKVILTYSQLTEEENIRAGFTDESACHADTPKKWRATGLQTLSGNTMKVICERKSSHSTEFL